METTRLLELLLADRVRGLAVKLRDEELPDDIREEAAFKAWHKARPIIGYIPRAMALLEEARDVMLSGDASGPDQPRP